MKKYLPYIVGYAIYASIILIVIHDESRSNYWPMFIGWIITAPLIVLCIGYFIWKYRKNNSEEFEESILDVDNSDDEDKLFPNKWTLMEFARNFGHMQIGEFRNEYGIIYHKCSFTKEDGSIIYVSFFSQLGELTPEEVKNRKDELFVGQMESGKYYLYAKGVKAWEDVCL